MIDEIAEFDAAVTTLVKNHPGSQVIGQMFCTRCGGPRRMNARLCYPEPQARMGLPRHPRVASDTESPAVLACVLLLVNCVQCDTEYKMLRHVGPSGPEVLVVGSTYGSVATHTPSGVAYYLDQAHRANAMGARSAALAMFRAALEHLLFEQGFTDGMLNNKIQALQSAINKNAAPAWASNLDTEYLSVLNKLGNGALHPNGGDVTKQAQIDADLVNQVRDTFAGLLQVIYEIPHQKAATLAAMKAKAALLK